MKSAFLLAVMLVVLVGVQGCDSSYVRFPDPTPDDGLAMVKDYSVGYSGNVALSDKTVDDLNINGSAVLHDLVVMRDAMINGSCTGDHVKFNGKLHVNGIVTLNKAVVAESTDIHGLLTATQSSFHAITITFPKLDESSKDPLRVLLDECTTTSVEIKCQDGSAEPVIELDNSTVDGDITFSSGHGQVVMKNGATITGCVSGGVIRAG